MRRRLSSRPALRHAAILPVHPHHSAHHHRCLPSPTTKVATTVGTLSGMATSASAAAGVADHSPLRPPLSPPPLSSLASSSSSSSLPRSPTFSAAPSPSSAAVRTRSSMTGSGPYRWLRGRRFPLACLLCLSSIAASSYRIGALNDHADAQQSTRDDLARTLERLHAQVDRRKALLQQRLHAVWAVPLTAAAQPHTSPIPSPILDSSPPPQSPSASASSWLGWTGWGRWWGTAAASDVSEAAASPPVSPPPALPRLPLCASAIDTAALLRLPSSTTSLPSTSLVRAVVSDCDYLLHTGHRPTPSSLNSLLPHFDAQHSSATASPLSSPSQSVSQPRADAQPFPPAATSSGAVTGAVTRSGKRLMV